MSMDPDLVMTFKENIDTLFDLRINACGYYNSEEYKQHLNEVIELEHKITESLGETHCELLDEFYRLDELKGEQLASLSESCYRRGFNDALLLVGEIKRAENGHKSIFS